MLYHQESARSVRHQPNTASETGQLHAAHKPTTLQSSTAFSVAHAESCSSAPSLLQVQDKLMWVFTSEGHVPHCTFVLAPAVPS